MILITGGAGYIGSHVNKMLYKKGYETLVVDNLVYGHKEFVRWGKFIFADLSDVLQLKKIFKNNSIKAVMHFAAFTYVGESVEDPKKYYLNNLQNTLNLLNLMLEYGVNYFIFSSSCAIYGEPKVIPIPENHPYKPISPYGQTKCMIESILKDYSYAYGFKYISLRYFNAAGADPDSDIGEWHEPETHLIPLVLDVAIGNSDSIKVFGTDYPTSDGTCIRDYIHVNDLANAHILALEYLLSTGKSDIFNLGTEHGHSVKEVIKTVERVTGKKIKTIAWKRRKGDPPVLVASSKKAKNVLNWSPQFDLDTTIETAWKWHQKLQELKDK
ncbi:MAG TPA: UDP-glucose 4-epimerase GalE [Candidatus Desulfofervidus auxilii]|uniref:UDP-glucose 4-epimerase n=1 Tax=Desulfofervidus auxilii TaxID=1621989 RepID=A0A7V0I9U3_DESA2|nr:UDP-glucose 4-epimerase GalE [Candidatus Desulfofervidus auxilii]